MLNRKICIYEVTPLDTLNSVALKFGMKTAELLRLNRVPSCYHIQVGQILYVYEKMAKPPDSLSATERGRAICLQLDGKSGSMDADSSSAGALSCIQQRSATLPHSYRLDRGDKAVPYLERLRMGRNQHHFSQLSLGNYAKSLLSVALKESLNDNAILVTNEKYTNLTLPLWTCKLARERVECEVQRRLIPGRLHLLPTSIKFELHLHGLELGSVGTSILQLEYADMVHVQLLSEATQLMYMLNMGKNSSAPDDRTPTETATDALSTRKEGEDDTAEEDNRYMSSVVEYLTQRLKDHSLELLQLVVTNKSLNITETTPIYDRPNSTVFYFLVNAHIGGALLSACERCYRPESKTTLSACLTPPPSTVSKNGSCSAQQSGKLFILPILDHLSAILTTDAIKKLAAALPLRFRYSNWKLLYSTQVHGTFIQTLFHCTHDQGPSYFILEDDGGFQFGAYLPDSWSIQNHYYGTGECFLFSIYPTFKIYRWSGRNEFFIYSKEDMIAVGGGSGKFGIFVESCLLRGHTSSCDTFENPVLSHKADFKCMVLEIWGFHQTDLAQSGANISKDEEGYSMT